MFKIRLHAALLLLPLVGGCSSQQMHTTKDTKTQMIGMSEAEISTCMGPPVKKLAEEKSEIWSYKFGACILNLEVAGNWVKAVTYSVSVQTDSKLTEDAPCENVPSVASCLRWLRNSTIFDMKQ